MKGSRPQCRTERRKEVVAARSRNPRGLAGRKPRRADLRWGYWRVGQNTVEYLMMLAVIVGVILVVGKMFKPQISNIFNQIMGMVSGAASTVAQTNGVN